jgi:hypothetical protein
MAARRPSRYVLGVSLAVLALCWAGARPATPAASDREDVLANDGPY